MLAASLRGQTLSVGVKGGIPLTAAVEGSFGVHSGTPRYTVGPLVQVSFARSLAVEVDALYKRTGYDAAIGSFGTTTFTRVRANSWEFPILAKYYFSARMPFRLYAEAGLAVRHLSGVPIRGEVRDDPTAGVAAGGGLEFGARRLRIAPEVRYTRWSGRPFDDFGSHGFFARSVQNQADLLLGVRF